MFCENGKKKKVWKVHSAGWGLCQLILSDPRKRNKKAACMRSSPGVPSFPLVTPSGTQRVPEVILLLVGCQKQSSGAPNWTNTVNVLYSIEITMANLTICQIGVKGYDWQKGRDNNYIRTFELLLAKLAEESVTQLGQRVSAMSAMSSLEEITTSFRFRQQREDVYYICLSCKEPKVSEGRVITDQTGRGNTSTPGQRL